MERVKTGTNWLEHMVSFAKVIEEYGVYPNSYGLKRINEKSFILHRGYIPGMTAKEMSRVPTYTHGGRGSSPGPSSFLGIGASVEKSFQCCGCRGSIILDRLVPRMVCETWKLGAQSF